MKFTCPVCGYPSLEEPPRYEGGSPSLEICPSCGFQFGWTDDDQDYTYEQWRSRWKAEGMLWDGGRQPPPEGWDPVAQLASLEGDT
jgi:hypothetical protein